MRLDPKLRISKIEIIQPKCGLYFARKFRAICNERPDESLVQFANIDDRDSQRGECKQLKDYERNVCKQPNHITDRELSEKFESKRIERQAVF